MKVLAIIPARGGSKRLPGKNTRLLGGKQLVQWAIDAAIGSKLLDRILVSSDSEDVLNLSSFYNDNRITFLKRPENISQDDSKAIEYVNHALEFLNQRNEVYDIIVILQPTSPFTLYSDIDNTINLLEETNADSVVSIVKIAHDVNPLKMKVLSGDKLFPYLEEERGKMSNAEVPDVYVRNCSIYATTLRNIQNGIIIGSDCRGYEMPRERSVDINDSFDLIFAEFLLSRNSAINT